jgi:hypothetical protein
MKQTRAVVALHTRAIRKVTSSELLRKQATGKNYYIQKYIYILNVLLNLVTAGIEVLVSGDKFLYACVKESAACELSHVLTLSINSSLLLKRCDLNQLFS